MPIRSIPYILFIALLSMSAASSVSIRAGHADVPVAETAERIQPLAKGDPAPRFIVETVNGEPFYFDPQNLDRPVVLLAFRGGWCPFCNMYLSDMRFAIPEIREMGIDVLFLSSDRSALLFDSLKQETQEDIDGLDYTILSDANAQAAIALGIAFKASQRTMNWLRDNRLDIEDSSILKHGVLPVPAVFAIDSHGEIQFAFTHANYKVRLPAAELLAAAREIAAAD